MGSYGQLLSSQLQALRETLLERHEAEVRSRLDAERGERKETEAVSGRWLEMSTKLLEQRWEPQEELVPKEMEALKMRPTWRGSFQEALFRHPARNYRTIITASSATMKMKDALHEQNWLQRFVVPPRSPKQMVWSALGAFLILWDVITIPLALFNIPTFHRFVGIMERVSFSFWLVDMPLHLLFGLEIRGQVELRPSKLAKLYLRSWLLPDIFIVSIDAALLAIDAAIGEGFGMGDMAIFKSARFLRTLRLLRLLRLLRVAKLQQELMILANRMLSTHSFMLMKVVTGVIMMLVMNHIIACVWFGVGMVKLDGKSWIQRMALEEDNFAEAYGASLHWALTQFTPATNDIAPDNALERFFALVVILLAIGLFSSCISSISTTMSSLRSARVEQSKHNALLFRFFTERNLSVNLYGQVQEFLRKEGAFAVRLQEAEVQLLGKIPERMKMQLHEEMFLPALRAFNIWPQVNHLDDHYLFFNVCHQAMRETAMRQGQDAFMPGTDCKTVYYVDAGSMAYLSRQTRKERQVVGEEAVLCLPCLWSDWHHRGRLTAAFGMCTLVTLDVEEFGRLITRFGGPLYQHLQILGILLVSEVEATNEVEWVTDLGLQQEVLEALVARAEGFISILQKQHQWAEENGSEQPQESTAESEFSVRATAL